MTKIVARWRTAPVAFVVGLVSTVAWAALLVGLLSHRSGGDDLIFGRWSWRFLIPLAVVALIFALQVWLFLFRCRQLLFTYVVLAVFGVLLEAGFAWWLSTSPNQNLRALYGAAWNLGEPTVYRSHHYAVYELRPGYRDRTTGMSHNRFGFRGPAFQSPKPGKVYRIFILGGSTTYTIAVKDNRLVFSYLLERALDRDAARRAPGWRIEVVNAGVGGYTSAENLLRLIFHIGRFEPDLVMIQQGLNDVWPLTYDQFRSDFGHYRKSWYEPGFREVWWKRLARASNVLTFILARLGLFEIRTIKYFATRQNTYYGGSLKRAVPGNVGAFGRNTELMILAARRLGAKVILVSEP
ncbi:MAG: hypothetical protein KKC37_15800, partial [Proteobacteria bacterium]|nr:hypothetical protein [Pseudomonadota bacterium]